MKKKWISMLAAAAMLTGTLAGCAPKPVDSTTAATEAPAGTSKETEAGQEETPAADLPVLKVAVMPFLNSIPIEYMINDNMANGVKLITREASEKICRYAFEYAKINNRHKVTAIHKANIMKYTDGLFLEAFRDVAKCYP